MERGYSERILMTQVINARGEFRDNFHERGNTRTSLIKSIKKVFLSSWQWDSEMVKALRTTQWEPRCKKGTMVEALNHVGRLLFKCVIILLELTIFSINASGKVFKNQIGSFNCHSEKVLYLLRCNIFDDTCYVGKTRTKFRLRFNKYESKHQSF